MEKSQMERKNMERIPTADKNYTKCGLGSWKPDFLQRFSNPKAYLIIFCILGLLQGAYFAYLIGVLSTIEKRYSFTSKVSGIILIADNISPILTSIFIGYYSGKADRPKWIACGMFFVVCSYFLSALPYFMYGSARTVILSMDVVENKTEICEFQPRKEKCDPDVLSATIPAVSCFVAASFIRGFGSTAYYTVGTSYLDDNVPKKQAALYLGVSYTFRMMGPTLGFLMSSLCLRYYEDPTYDPGFTKEDPRWIGAWWIGFLGLGFMLLLFSFPMMLFPRVLPSKAAVNTKEVEEAKRPPTLKDMVSALKRLITCPFLFCFYASNILIGNAICGHFTFLPKYLETQFQKSASDANLFSGPTALLCMQAGMMIGSIIVRKCKPRPRYIAASVSGVDLLTAVFLLAFIMMGCPQMTMKGTERRNSELLLQNDCNRQCGCTTTVFEPVCAPEVQSTYFSPCFAGCTEYNGTNFGNCSCVHDKKGDFSLSSVISNYCPSTCNKLLPYIVILGIMRVVSSLTSVGSTLLFFRAADAKDKGLALGLAEALYSLFVFVPYPLIFGAITDAACLVWEVECGTSGNCWVYDATKFRYYLHSVACGFTIVGLFFDFGVIYYSGDTKDFYEDEGKSTDDRKRSNARQSFSSVSINRTYSIK